MELEALSKICHEYGMRLFVDGVRLAYALLAKGRVLGAQLEALFEDGLYEYIGFRLCGGREGGLLW